MRLEDTHQQYHSTRALTQYPGTTHIVLEFEAGTYIVGQVNYFIRLSGIGQEIIDPLKFDILLFST